jgi:hypothetical protein
MDFIYATKQRKRKGQNSIKERKGIISLYPHAYISTTDALVHEHDE